MPHDELFDWGRCEPTEASPDVPDGLDVIPFNRSVHQTDEGAFYRAEALIAALQRAAREHDYSRSLLLRMCLQVAPDDTRFDSREVALMLFPSSGNVLSVHYLRKQGRLNGERFGRVWYYRAADIRALLSRQTMLPRSLHASARGDT